MDRHVLVLALIFTATLAERVSYDGYQVLRVIPRAPYQIEYVNTVLTMIKEDVWKYPSGVNRPVDINVPGELSEKVIKLLSGAGLDVTIMIDDVQALIDREKADYDTAKLSKLPNADFDYSQYHSLDEINEWMTTMESVNDNVKLVDIAKSTEGRDLKAMVISTNTNSSKPAFWIEGGIHAREWISPATVIYMVGQMLENYDDENIKRLVDSFEWHILPVMNPDGYVYTWTKNRLWRKTRSKHGICTGVDPNRNWDFEWRGSGSSADPCSDTYRGPSPFSEPEVKGVADYLKNLTSKDLKGFIDFHSYSELWMSPWGYETKLPADFDVQDEGSKVAVEALKKVHGTSYTHGNIAEVIYVANGNSADWSYGANGVKYSYAVELRDKGQYGFILPADQIIPCGEETLQGLIALANYVASK